MAGYSIQQVSKKTNLKAHVLRYYEREGLIPFVNRSNKGIRQYSNDNIEWIGVVCCLKNTGMSIKQIKDFVELILEGDTTLKQRCDMLIDHKEKIEEHISELQNNLHTVDRKIRFYSSKMNDQENFI